MIKWTEDKLYKVHMISLEILIEIDRICRKHDIKYSITGGTLLGAVRHDGFIPWDNDADVAMLRGEYRKFKRIARKELDRRRFFLQDHSTDRKYRWGYPKIRRKGTVYTRRGQEHLGSVDGIFVDILVMDNIPNNKKLREKHKKCCEIIRGMMYSAVGKYSESDPKKRKMYEMWSKIPISVIFLMNSLLSLPFNLHRTELVGHYTLPYGDGMYGMPRECFDEMIDMELEGYKLRAYRKYDLYLRTLYGNYDNSPSDMSPGLEISKLKFVKPKLPKMPARIKISKSDKVMPKEWEDVVTHEDGRRKKIICYGVNIFVISREGKNALEKMHRVIEIFQENESDVVLLLMPSKKVKLKDKLMDKRTYMKYRSIIKEVEDNPNMLCDETLNFGRTLALCDAYYGDWTKITWYFKKQGKPIMIQNLEI